MESLLKKSVADLVELFVTTAALQQSAAVSGAKALIALIAVSGSEATARATLKKAGASDCTVKNAMQLVWAYDEVVRPGHATEEWFDALLYLHAVEVRRAIKKVGIAKLVATGLLTKPAKKNLVEIELLADTGLDRAERIAKDEADVLAKIAADKKTADAKAKADANVVIAATLAPAGTATTPPTEGTATTPAPAGSPPATPTEVATLETAKKGEGKKSTLQQFDALISSAEKFVGAVFPGADDVTVETMTNRVAALLVIVGAAVTTRATVAKTKAA